MTFDTPKRCPFQGICYSDCYCAAQRLHTNTAQLYNLHPSPPTTLAAVKRPAQFSGKAFELTLTTGECQLATEINGEATNLGG